jgi:uncharacterized protein (DUF885 family)
MIYRRTLLGSMAAIITTALTTRGEAADMPLDLKSALQTIFDEMVDGSPVLATYLGLDKGARAALKSKLDPATAEEGDRQRAMLERSLGMMSAIDRSQLSGMDRINYDAVVWELSHRLDGAKAFPFGAFGEVSPYVVSQLTGSYQMIPDFLDSSHTIENREDAESYLARLQAYADVLDQETERLAEDVIRGMIPPHFVFTKALAQMKAQHETKPADSPMVKSIVRRTKEKGLEGEWEKRATEIYESKVIPALGRQIAALDAVKPKSSHDAGVWRLPNGAAYYRYAVRSGTSTEMTADEIHEVGLAKVKELEAELDSVLRGEGLSNGSTGERLAAIAKDPRYLYENTDAGKAQLLDDLNRQVDVVQAKLPDYFGVLPRSKIIIKRVPVETELGAPGGYYQPPTLDGSRPGMYYINLRDTAEVPKWSLPTLTYHEAIPGHHMQISIAQENKGLPEVRKISDFNAYIEGWALYAEEVAAHDMNMYAENPVGKIGYLHDAMFRACRLVVDTGLHHKRWTREQAMDFMKMYLGDPNETEVERYCVWPGQALGYMIGKIKWLDLRARMMAKQGGAFDIRRFHDTGLLAGAMPLSVLEQAYGDAGLI